LAFFYRDSGHIATYEWQYGSRSRPSAQDMATQLRVKLWRCETNEQIVDFIVDPVWFPNHPKNRRVGDSQTANPIE